MKINFRNEAARLRFSSSYSTCNRCPFRKCVHCPLHTSLNIDCDGKGWWIGGESLDIFKV